MDNSSKKVELHKQHTALTEKTTFMFLTAATASIGFILTQLKQVIWSDLIWLIIGSLLFLALSFFFGCAQLGHKADFLKLNSEYISLSSNKSSMLDENEFWNKFQNTTNKLTSTIKWQKTFLFLGAVLYFIYSILDIYLKYIIEIS